MVHVSVCNLNGFEKSAYIRIGVSVQISFSFLKAFLQSTFHPMTLFFFETQPLKLIYTKIGQVVLTDR